MFLYPQLTFSIDELVIYTKGRDSEETVILFFQVNWKSDTDTIAAILNFFSDILSILMVARFNWWWLEKQDSHEVAFFDFHDMTFVHLETACYDLVLRYIIVVVLMISRVIFYQNGVDRKSRMTTDQALKFSKNPIIFSHKDLDS